MSPRGDGEVPPSLPPDWSPRPAPDASTGLTTAEARKRLAQNGPNVMVEVMRHPVWRVLGMLWAPMSWTLEAIIVVQVILGNFADAGAVALLLLFNTVLGFFLERRAWAILNAVKTSLAFDASARRDGKWVLLPAADLVRGDVVKLTLGTVVAADVSLIHGSVLLDQSMLTGQSIAVEGGPGTKTFAGALVRRGEAVALVTATGTRTKFGRTAELLRTAAGISSQQNTVLRVSRNLVVFNSGIALLLTLYAILLPMPIGEIVPLSLVAILAAMPVALPSMVTFAAAAIARSLAARGVLPTSLSAACDVAAIDILCCDKTGTLTRNEPTVVSVLALPPFNEAHLLALAALASANGEQNPVDAAICAAAARKPFFDTATPVAFTPFDPALRLSEATAYRPDGTIIRIVKGAFAAVADLARPDDTASAVADELLSSGFRVLAVATGPRDHLVFAGFITLSDPPRDDSAALVEALANLGVRTIMVTGDARATAEMVAAAVGLTGAVRAVPPLQDDLDVEAYSIFAGMLPKDKYHLVKALQKDGHIVGICGAGANDAPALRRANMGIAVASATDVAKSSAGLLLTEAGLGGIVAAVKEGRIAVQKTLTFTLRSIIHKIVPVLFLTAGLILTGHAILTPFLMVLTVVTGSFLTLSSSTGPVRPSQTPDVWRIHSFTIAGIIMGVTDLIFCIACLAVGKYGLDLDESGLRTLTVVTLVISRQAVFYVARDRRRLWRSHPGRWQLASSVADLSIIGLLAGFGVLMAALPIVILVGLLGAAVLFAVVLDEIKVTLFHRMAIA